jgi:hypothetical protein
MPAPRSAILGAYKMHVLSTENARALLSGDPKVKFTGLTQTSGQL